MDGFDNNDIRFMDGVRFGKDIWKDAHKSKKIKTESTNERSDSRVSDMSLESADAINSINSALMEHEE